MPAIKKPGHINAIADYIEGFYSTSDTEGKRLRRELIESLATEYTPFMRQIIIGNAAGALKAASRPLFNFLDKRPELIVAKQSPDLKDFYGYYGVSGAPAQYRTSAMSRMSEISPDELLASERPIFRQRLHSPDYVVHLDPKHMKGDIPIHEGLHVAYGIKEGKRATSVGPPIEHAEKIVDHFLRKGLISRNRVDQYLTRGPRNEGMRHAALEAMATNAARRRGLVE